MSLAEAASRCLGEMVSAMLRGVIAGERAGLELSALVESRAAVAPSAVAKHPDESRGHAGNALYGLIAGQPALLQFSAGIERRLGAFGRAEKAAAVA